MQEFLNWLSDPLLLDDTPKVENQWLTANKLLEQKALNRIFLKQGILNLYSIIVRKIDFKSGERLLQRLPYITLPESLGNQLRKSSLSLAERCYHYFQDTAINYSIKKWQQKIINYTENQHRLPFPLFRLSDLWQEFLTQEYVPFQSARGESFHIPTKLSGDLAYFLGVVIGDGHLNYHNVELVDFSQENMVILRALAKALFGFEGAISGEKKIWLLHLNNKWLVRLVNFLTDQPITGKKYHALREPLIFISDEKLRWEFWSGALDADGSYKSTVNFCSSSKYFINEFVKVLNIYNIKYSTRTIKTEFGISYAVNIKASSKDLLGKFLQPRHPSKQKDFQNYLNKKRRHIIDDPINYQINRFNPESILTFNNEHYFNFTLLPNLNVINCTSLLQTVRKIWSWTQQDLADYLKIPKGQLASYEYRNSLPLQLLEKLLPKLPNAPNKLMPFLVENKLDLFRSRKTIARLDLQPNSTLLALVKNLSMRKRYLLIEKSENSESDLYKSLSDYFSINISNNQIQNSVLYQYINTFFQTNEDTKTI
ncbi:MAG: hypothetical protein ACTSXA_12665 [Candidatus Heimdallarchaeota archaeon]